MNTNQQFKHTFTIFTATLNRAGLLPRVRESLQKQTYRDFEWVIGDGGSTDGTEELIREWQKTSPFPIRFHSEKGEGKNAAINRGAIMSEGRFFAILDSDDWYVPQTLERFLHHWNGIPVAEQSKFVGVCALCSYESGKLIGTRFPQDIFDSDAIDLRFKHHIEGDKAGMMRTEVLRQYPFPKELGKFLGDSVVWNRIARSYLTRFVNEELTVKEYQGGGLTDKVYVTWVRNSAAALLCSKELIGLGERLPLDPKIRGYANYVRHSLHQRVPFGQQIAGAPSKMLFFLCYLPGIYLRISDQKVLRADEKSQGKPNRIKVKIGSGG
jgi:glycosyltransferase involved in cell wall biosynthesis